MIEQSEREDSVAAGNSTEDRFRSLAKYLDVKPEIGLGKMLLSRALEPRDPFKPDARRNFRKGFILAAVFSAVFIAWLVWFNAIR